MNILPMLREIASYGEFFTLTDQDTGQVWHPVSESYASGCTDLIDETVTRYDTTDLRIGASLVQFSHASRLWSPTLACALGYGVVPDYASLERARDSARLRLPDPVGVPVDPANPCPSTLYRVVVQQHLEPLAAGLRIKMAPGLLFGNAASALVEAARALITVRPELRAPATRLTTALLGTGRLAATGAVTVPDLRFRRRSCCLYYRTPAGSKCSDCGLA